MKKKIMSVVTMVAVMAVTTASITGCGAQASAADQGFENGETIIVTESGISSDSQEETASTEVIGGTEETNAGAENEDIVLYAEKGEHYALPFDGIEFTANAGRIIAAEDINVCDDQGYIVGYIKNGATINIDETATDITWSRFENPITGTDYDYLYVLNEYLVNEDIIIIGEEDLKQRIIDFLNSRNYALPTILDAPDDDMEVEEHRLEKEYSDDLEVDYWIYQYFYDSENNPPLLLGRYMTYYIECQDDGDGVICKVYYKDLIENASN